MTRTPDLYKIMREYERERRAEQSSGHPNSLANDALIVVLEWGPAKRLPEAWRLEARQKSEEATQRESALAAAHEVTQLAYELTAEAWPRDRPEVPVEVDRVAGTALELLSSRYPHLSRESLSRAISLANYSHAK